MASQKNMHVPDDLLTAMSDAAQAEGKTPEEWLEHVVRARLDDRKWQDLLAYGRQKGNESGYTEDDVPGVVKEWRREQKDRGR